MTRMKAFKPDKVSTYTIMSYRFADDSDVYITTIDVDNPHSKKLTNNEVFGLKQWLRSGDCNHGSFSGNQDNVYVHLSSNMEGYVHFRSGETEEYLYTYVPIDFIEDMCKENNKDVRTQTKQEETAYQA